MIKYCSGLQPKPISSRCAQNFALNQWEAFFEGCVDSETSFSLSAGRRSILCFAILCSHLMSWNTGRVWNRLEACATDTCCHILVHFPNPTQPELPAWLETDGKSFSRQQLERVHVCVRACTCRLPSCHVSATGELPWRSPYYLTRTWNAR